MKVVHSVANGLGGGGLIPPTHLFRHEAGAGLFA